MAIDTTDPAKAGDDFIPLGSNTNEAEEEEDFLALGAASDAESDSGTSDDEHDTDTDSPSFHPHRITLAQFRRLLACYPTTVEQVHRRKTMLKLQPKPEKGSKRRAEKKAGSVSANLRGAALIQKTDFGPSEMKHIADETRKVLELDAWRYEELPGVIAERRSQGEGEGASLNKNELVTVMEWKTKHGLPRPTLMGMVKSNHNKTVLTCTAAAIAALPTEDPSLAPSEAFPKPSLDALTPLRGVGTATASLILSIATAHGGDPALQIPFYSDDLYLWLCLKDYPETEAKAQSQQLISSAGGESTKPRKKVSKFKRPNGELNVKYNLHEYRQLWNAALDLRLRLNSAVEDEYEATAAAAAGGESDAGEKRLVSHNDIEKVAYVLRNIAVSGFYPDVDPEDILAAHARQEARALEEARKAAAAKKEDEGDGAKKSGKKRKRQEKEEKKQKQKGGRNSKKTKTEKQ